ncbi:MAG: radical SAM protein [Deltaproteobacteria bacterium]|nr:radical SAM protein [Deltaproteobacteria bacterium]
MVRAFRDGVLQRRAAEAVARLSACDLCPRRCGVDRTAGSAGPEGALGRAGPAGVLGRAGPAGVLGKCRTDRRARLCSFGPHFGEEDPLVGRHGSGTVFFAGCNLNCTFCQNCDISQGRGVGREVTAEQLAAVFIAVQGDGCHNLNLVTPTHVLAQILEALALACARGFALPVLWNCGGYESPEALALLDGIVDIYMPDLKFSDAAPARDFCDAPDYPEVARAAIGAMHRQVGDLVIDDAGLARRGLLVRHLVMPGGLAGTAVAMRFLAGLSPRTYVNVMGQYRPEHRAGGHPVIGRRPTAAEMADAFAAARVAGLARLDGYH